MEATSSPPTTSEDAPRRGRRRRKPNVPIHVVDPARTWASVSMAAVTVLLFLAVGGPWWQASLTVSSPLTATQVASVVEDFDLGGAITCVANEWPPAQSPCLNVSDHQEGVRDAVSVGINAALVVLGVASALACVLATLGAFGVRLRRLQLTVEIALVFLVVLATFGLLAGTAAIGPGPQASGYCWTLSGNVSSCPLFWGATPGGVVSGGCDTCYYELSWGGGIAYDETLLAAGLATITGAVLWLGRKRPYTLEETAAWAVKNAPISLPPPPTTPPEAFGPRAPISAVVPEFHVAETAWTCPRCHAYNSRFALQCGACNTDRPKE